MFTKTIEALIALKYVLTVAADNNKVLDMFDTFKDYGKITEDTTVINCGTPACVVGYASIDEPFLAVIGCGGGLPAPHDVWDTLEDILTEESPNGTVGRLIHTYDSLFNPSAQSRKLRAHMTELFTTEEIDSLNHLNAFSNEIDEHAEIVSIQDVKDYIDLIISKLKLIKG